MKNRQLRRVVLFELLYSSTLKSSNYEPKACASGSSLILVIGLIAELLYPSVSPAATTCDPPIARMVSVQGNVEVQKAGQTQWQPARLNDTYCAGDRIQVGERSRAAVALINQPVLRLDQNTTITLGGVKDERTSLIDLARGALHFFSRLPRGLEVNTAFVNAGVEGTEGLVRVEADRTLLSIFDGRVLAANLAGSLPLTSGQSAIAEKGKPPVLTVVVRPRDAVQWALYYPPVAYFRPEDLQGPEPWREMVRKSLDAYMKGDYQAAFEAIKGVPTDIREPRFFAYRAQLLLGVGRVDEASKDIQQALSLSPNYSDALALQSIIAIVQNDKERALDVARKAVAADPKSATTLIALSFAQQANFDLEGALESLQQAVQVNPNDALAWARLSEVHLSFARLNQALEAAQKAVSLEPNLARTQTVLGFAYLTRVNTAESKKAFERAIELDQADHLPRLGLGLAKIREGDLEAGGREIEIAASLNPNNSIVRSYLGKTYYEEKRIGLDSREYSIAKELDPNDPTPWFYDAIAKQTTNRPVEALRDMEKAIELNNNRAVFRSSLLLDSDLAARSAALGRIYSDLGFQQLALVEGWKSVNTDPTNFSAHRFLADSYAVLPRHEIARVSELLQSQLLQPINITPVQPRLAESNLFLISGQGPGTLSFNEFNPIFNRNRIAFQTSALGGENSTYAGEGVLSGIYQKASFSIGGFHFQTKGFHRPDLTLNASNTDQRDTFGNAFLQFELSPETSIQAEYRYRNSERGDLRLRFFPNDFFRGLSSNEERNTFRLGGRHSFSPDSIFLGSFTYQKADTSDKVDRLAPPANFVDIETPAKALSGEVQHLFRSQYVNLVSGLGYFNIDAEFNTTLDFRSIVIPRPPPLPPLIIPAQRTTTNEIDDIRHTNVYLYSYIKPLENLTFTLGVSGDFLERDRRGSRDEDQANPKIGITWNPFPGTTVRGAAFRTLKRTLITNQTLEPTQVAGFNQFFDDFNGTKAWRYGGAIDQKFTKTIFGGVEFSKRDLEVPFLDATNPVNPITRTEDQDEKLARTYLFWTPHPWWALRTEYAFERIQSQGLTDQPRKVDTHRVPLGINFYHPSGFSASLTTTYWNQDGTFVLSNRSIQSGRDDFWTVDAAINYRLPKRYGFLTVGGTNLTDQKFNFFDRDFRNPAIRPDRMVFGSITLALP
jgi:tetratricopeptide (TPR) repeat protein